MSRRFAADNSEIRYPAQAGFPADGAISFVIVARRRAVGAVWHCLLTAHDSSGQGDNGVDIEFTDVTADTIYYAASGALAKTTTTYSSTTDWLIFAVTRAAGAGQTPRVHTKNLTAATAWAHSNFAAAVGNGATIAGGSWRIGEWEDVDDLDANVAVDALWCANLSDVQLETLTSSTQQFMDLHGTVPAAFIHEHNQATAGEDIVDLTGNGHTATGTISGTTDAVGISGTAMDTGTDPPGWAYGVGAFNVPAFTAQLERAGNRRLSPGLIGPGKDTFGDFS